MRSLPESEHQKILVAMDHCKALMNNLKEATNATTLLRSCFHLDQARTYAKEVNKVLDLIPKNP